MEQLPNIFQENDHVLTREAVILIISGSPPFFRNFFFLLQDNLQKMQLPCNVRCCNSKSGLLVRLVMVWTLRSSASFAVCCSHDGSGIVSPFIHIRKYLQSCFGFENLQCVMSSFQIRSVGPVGEVPYAPLFLPPSLSCCSHDGSGIVGPFSHIRQYLQSCFQFKNCFGTSNAPIGPL